MKRRILAVLLAAIMVLSAVPFSVFAEDATIACPGDKEIHTKDNCSYTFYTEKKSVCDEDGYKVGICDKCGAQFIYDLVPAANTPHVFTKVNAKAATCTAEGYNACYQCTVCKKYFDNNTADAKVKADAVIAKIAHKWVMDKDCTKYVCEYGCGATTTTEGGVHETHDWVLDKFVAAPTCKDDNVATFKCNTANCTVTREVKTVASKYMHTLTKVAAKQATCTADGNVEYWHCSTCNRNFNGADADAFAEITDVVEPAGHKKGVIQAITLPTCLNEGTETWQCSVCLKNFDVKTAKTPDYFYWIYNTSTEKYRTDADGNKLVFVKAKHNAEDNVTVATDADLASGEKFVSTEKIYHVFNPAADVKTKATCTTYGYVQRICVKCGHVNNEQIEEPTGHNLETATEVTGTDKSKAPGCLTAGYKTMKCLDCNGEFIQPIAATGHTDVVVRVGATCTTKGFVYTICTNNCDGYGYTKKTELSVKVGDDTKKLTITEASVKDGSVKWDLGIHDEEVKEINVANCTTAGSEVKYCKICKVHTTTPISAKGHNFVVTWADSIKAEDRTLANATYTGTVEPANCTDASYLKIKCTDCDAYSKATDYANRETKVSLKVADANGHDDYVKTVLPHCVDLNNTTTQKYDPENKWNDTKGYTVSYCPTCDKEVSARTATGATYSLAIEYTYDEAKAIHNIDGVTPEEYIAGNCTVKGLDKYICKEEGCKKGILVVQSGTGAHVPPANVADYIVAPVAPKCEVPGSTGEYKCTKADCGVTVANTTISALKHNFKKEFAGTDSTCTAQGVKAIYSCSQPCCAKKFFVDIEYNKDGSFKDAKVLEDWASLGITEDKDKTVENAKKFSDAKKELAAHVAKAQYAKVEAHCVNTGKLAYIVCATCNKNYVGVTDFDEDSKKFYTGTVKTAEELVIPADETTFVDATFAPTCTAAGYKYQECSVCDFGRVVDYKKPLDHNWKLVDDDVAASCTQYGGDYYECKRTGCGEKKIEGKVAKLAHKKGDLELGYGIAAHNDVVYYVCGVKEATKGAKCDKCDFTVTNHINKKTIVAPTCTTAGYVVETCADPGCKAILGETKVTDPALRHTVNWIETTPATETSAGVETNTCTRCGNVETRPIAPKTTVYLDLTYANANGKEGFAESSLITVKVVLSSGKAAIRTLNYGLDYDQAKLEFVSATYSDTFSVSAINDDATNGVVKFAGMSANPVEVGDAVEIATVTFRVKGGIGATTASFSFTADSEAYLATGVDVKVDTVLDPASITIVKLMNVYDKDATIDMQDALAIYDIIQAKGYNVAADLDKDGTVDAYDLQLFYNYFVGSMTAAEIFAAN